MNMEYDCYHYELLALIAQKKSWQWEERAAYYLSRGDYGTACQCEGYAIDDTREANEMWVRALRAKTGNDKMIDGHCPQCGRHWTRCNGYWIAASATEPSEYVCGNGKEDLEDLYEELWPIEIIHDDSPCITKHYPPTMF